VALIRSDLSEDHQELLKQILGEESAPAADSAMAATREEGSGG